ARAITTTLRGRAPRTELHLGDCGTKGERCRGGDPGAGPHDPGMVGRHAPDGRSRSCARGAALAGAPTGGIRIDGAARPEAAALPAGRAPEPATRRAAR